MGGFVPTPEQYRMVMQRRQEEESLAKKAGRAARSGVEVAGGLVAGEAARLTEPIKRTAAIAGQAAGDFSSGFGGEPEAEDDPVMRYIEQNPDKARQFLMDTRQPYKPEPATQPQTTNITSSAVAANMLREKSQKEQAGTYRRMPDGSYTNQGTGGEVVLKNGQSVGPDIGAPGRGGVSQPTEVGNPMDDAAYRNMSVNLRGPEETADMAKAESERKLFEILQRNPFAREAIMNEMAIKRDQAGVSNAYAKERAKGQAEQDVRAEVLGVEADIEESYQMTLRDIEGANMPPEQKAQLQLQAEQRRDLEKRRAGIPTDATWNRLG